MADKKTDAKTQQLQKELEKVKIDSKLSTSQ